MGRTQPGRFTPPSSFLLLSPLFLHPFRSLSSFLHLSFPLPRGGSFPIPALLSRLWAKTGLQLRCGESRKHSRPFPEAHALPGHPSPLPPPRVPNSKLEWGLLPGVPRTWRRGQHVPCAPWVPWRAQAGRAGPCPGRAVPGPPTERQDLRGGAPPALIPLIWSLRELVLETSFPWFQAAGVGVGRAVLETGKRELINPGWVW